MYKIGICDDCARDSEILKRLILKNPACPEEVFFYLYSSGEALLDQMKMEFDVIFLDVCMRGMDGNMTAERIRECDKRVILVFYTGFVALTYTQLRYQPFRYLMKNMNSKELKKNIGEILEEMKVRGLGPTLMVKNEKYFKGMIRVKAEDILYIEIYNRVSRVHLTEQKLADLGIAKGKMKEYTDFICTRKLSDIYEMFCNYGFEYAHNSYIINLNCIAQKSRERVVLEGGHELNISKSKSPILNKHFSEFLSSKYAKGRRK